jgi:AraC-like DNA-binding protein
MPSSAVRGFTDPDDFAASIRASSSAMKVLDRGNFAAEITRIDLHRLWMQRFSETLPRVMHSTNVTGRAIIVFLTRPGSSLHRGPVELGPTGIALLGTAYSQFHRSSGPIGWGSMSLTKEDMHDVGTAIAGRDLTASGGPVFFEPPPSAMARLQRLHAAAGYLAENSPEIIANDCSARGLEQALIEAMVASLSTDSVAEDLSAYRRHERIMRRVHAMIEQHPEEPVYLADLCAAAGVSERTLRTCCYESLGMGPKQYLLRRRMALARQALQHGNAAETTVTQIAAQYGFWQFGRFSVEYKALFGEMPSTTLHTPPS